MHDDIRIERYDGRRDDLRWSFELADDSPIEIDRLIEHGEVFVAVDPGETADRRICGHLQLVDHEGDLEITNLAVRPDRQRRGIGRALVHRAIAIAEASGVALWVATATADVGNLAFYQQLGFRMDRIERDVFTVERGYPEGLEVDGLALRDRVWFRYEP